MVRTSNTATIFFAPALALACTVSMGAAALLSSPVTAAPVAAPVQSSGQSGGQSSGLRWTLDFRPGELRLHIDEQTGRAFWYFTYMVVNRSGADRMWAPRLDLLTDDGRLLTSGRDVPSRVVRELREILGNELVEDQNQILGEILQGIEHAKEGVVVWPAWNLEVTDLTIFVSGLSGESEIVVDPKSGEDVVLRRNHWLRYSLPGDALPKRTDAVRLAERGWVMR